MKLITIIQAGALVLLAVIGAYASSDKPVSCPATNVIVAEHCDL